MIAIENVRLFTELEARRPPVDGGSRAADRHRRDPAGHLQLADRPPARDGRRGRKHRADSAARPMSTSSAWRASRCGSVARHGRTPGSVPIGWTGGRKPMGAWGAHCARSRTIHIEDLLALPETEFPETLARVRNSGTSSDGAGRAAAREGMPVGFVQMSDGRRSAIHGQADRAGDDLRRPSGGRHRERPALQGAAGPEP